MIPSGRASTFLFVIALAAIPALGTVTYTCDSTITGTAAGDLGLSCTTLNSTLNAIYGAAFTNADASIYISLSSSSSLGESWHEQWNESYSNYLAALAADDPGDPGLASLPASDPYSGGNVILTNSLFYALPALGFSPTSGFTSATTPTTAVNCSTPGVGNCYDGIIFINDGGSTSNLWLRTGTQANGQYDFYSIIEHETDEVLGTASCLANGTGADECGTGQVSAGDLFRYVCGSTARSFGASGSACFSVNGGVTDLQTYNNTTNGDDFGDWATTCANVQDATGCPGPAGAFDHNIGTTTEIALLNAVGYSLNTSQSTPEPATVGVLGMSLVGLVLMRRRRAQ